MYAQTFLEEAKTVSGLADDDTYFLPIVICFEVTHLETANFDLDRISNECRKTKTKVMTLANHKEHQHYREPIKTRNKFL